MARKLDYRWHLRQVMAARGMFATTDLIEPLAQRGIQLSSSQVYRLVVERPGAAEPEDPDGAAGHPGLLDGRADRTGRGRGTGPEDAGRRRRRRRGRRLATETGPHHRRRAVTGADDRHADVLADPVGVVDLVAQRSSRAWTGRRDRRRRGRVAGGRAKRRRLAQALAERPAVLTDGRSPAPRGRRGPADRAAQGGRGEQSRRRSAPGAASTCAPCNAAARTGTAESAVPRREPCAGCGQIRQITSRDRHGRPRCAAARPMTDGDPLPIIARGDQPPSTRPCRRAAAAAVHAATSRAGQRRQLAWALQDQPELLTGAGAEAPVPVGAAADRRADADAGAHGIVRPALPALRTRHHAEQDPRRVRVCRNCARQVPRRDRARAAVSTANQPPGTSTGNRCVHTV